MSLINADNFYAIQFVDSHFVINSDFEPSINNNLHLKWVINGVIVPIKIYHLYLRPADNR